MYFDTGDIKTSKLLNSLAYSASDHQISDIPEVLQMWLEGVIARLEKLPQHYQTAINSQIFYIGDMHFRMPQEEVHSLSAKLVKALEQGLAAAADLGTNSSP